MNKSGFSGLCPVNLEPEWRGPPPAALPPPPGRTEKLCLPPWRPALTSFPRGEPGIPHWRPGASAWCLGAEALSALPCLGFPFSPHGRESSAPSVRICPCRANFCDVGSYLSVSYSVDPRRSREASGCSRRSRRRWSQEGDVEAGLRAEI